MNSGALKKYLPIVVLSVAVVADQWLKIYVKLNFMLGEGVRVFDWFYIYFVENPGMAFGLTIGSKVFLTVFRIIVSGFVLWYLLNLIRQGYKTGYTVVIALVFAGAAGNIIDSLFYGMMFSESTVSAVADLFPAGGGYAPFLMGKVVDMFYFPLFTFPDWMPLLGGEVFFSPVFNLADSYITVSIFLLIIFYHRDFNLTMDSMFKKTVKDHDAAD